MYQLELREVTLLSVALRVAAAIIVGGLIGLERGLKNRPAGLRTYMVVCLGSCLIMLTNQYIYQVTGTGDPVRMAAQVVSGIGFLGAGTIIVTRRNRTHIKHLYKRYYCFTKLNLCVLFLHFCVCHICFFNSFQK